MDKSSLSALLKLRLHREAEADHELGVFTARVRVAQKNLLAVHDELVAWSMGPTQTSSPGQTGGSHHVVYGNLAYLQGKRQHHLQELQDLEAGRVAREQAYVLARRDREVLEKLLEDRRSATQKAAELKEQKRLDDAMQAVRRQRSSRDLNVRLGS